VRALRTLVAVIAFSLLPVVSAAQLYRFPTGTNRSDVAWHELGTEHFVVIYHDGLDSVAHEAAAVAEAIYPVVTGNLATPVSGRTHLYLSDLDDVPNAFAFGDRYIFVWLRGILDDMSPGGIRSSGSAKWLRAVITHEFTHIVIEHATKTWSDEIVPSPDVPRWFNEGTARAMEPDPWTTDLDMVLRVAAVNGRLDYDLLEPGILDGTLLYETGHSLVRYMLWRFGDSVIARILHGGVGFFGYDFPAGVIEATGMTIGEIYGEWYRAVTATYAAEYATREEAREFSTAITSDFPVVFGARLSPDRTRLALLGSRGQSRPSRLYVMRISDSLRATGDAELLLDEPGIDAEFSWSPDGTRIVIAKYRYGAHRALVHDLFLVDALSGSMHRLTSNESVRDPAWSPDGSAIVAVQKRGGRDNLVIVDPASGALRALTAVSGDVQLYTPSWSPDGAHIAVSLFDEDGTRAVVAVDARTGAMRDVVRDKSISRYPVWSPDGRRIAFTSLADSIPNIHIVESDGSDRRVVTAVGGGLGTMQWIPGMDSLLALSFDTRDEIVPRIVPADRVAEMPSEPIVRARFSAWRTAGFALRVPEDREIARARTIDSGAYVSLLHLRPLVIAFPVAEPGVTRQGVPDSRFGLSTYWTDPQFKHLLFGYLTVGQHSTDAGGELYYVDNQLPFSSTLHLDYSIAYRRLVDGAAYYQRNRNIGLMLDFPLPDPNTLDIGHHFFLGALRRNLEPWNLAPLTSDSVGLVPQHARLSEIAGGYRYGARTLYIDARYRRSEPALGSDLDYHRIDLAVSGRWPIVAEGEIAILARAEGAAHFGEQLPQEQLRIDADDQLSGRLLNAFNILDLPPTYRVRGIEETLPGNRVVVASIGIQSRLPLLEDLFPLLSIFRPQSVLFLEAGGAWHADSTVLDIKDIRVGAGGELRTEILPRIWLSFGAAHDLAGPNWDVYLRFTQGL
jgi:hypothetical protein